MPAERMTIIFGLLIVGLLVYELVAVFDHQSGDTISEIVWNLAAQRPILPFVLGLIMGHFFWQRVS